MPFDIFSLSRLIADQYPDKRVQKLIGEYIDDDSAFVRRAILISISFIGGEFAKANLSHIRRHLEDISPWVAYDAITVLNELGEISKTDKEVLMAYAKKYKGLKKAELAEIKVREATECRDKLAAEVLLTATIT